MKTLSATTELLGSGHLPFGSLEIRFRRTAVTHRARKAIQGGDCCPRRMSLLRFPWLFPIRNPSELRGLHRRSYFGPRTCVGGITNVIEVSGALNQGFPFSPIEGGVMRMSHFISQTLWNTMRAADPCPTNNAKRAKHSKILKPRCFFVFTLLYQLAYSVLCAIGLGEPCVKVPGSSRVPSSTIPSPTRTAL